MININWQQLPILVKREFWEHRWAFQFTPLIIFGLSVLLISMAIIFGAHIDGNSLFTDSAIRELAEVDADTKAAFLRVGLLSINGNFNFIMLIVLFFYLVGSLYDDRKDRSILFWKSLPISDGTTILSKLLTAGIAVPLFYMLTAAVLQVFTLSVASIYAAGADVSIWENVWKPASLPSLWLNILVSIPVQLLWLLPMFGWFMLCSAFAPRLPWLISLAIPGLVGLFQNYLSFLDNLKLPVHNIALLIVERFGKGVLPISMQFDEDDFDDIVLNSVENLFTVSDTLSRLVRVDMLVGIVIGLAFLYGAIYLRNRATDN